MEELRFTLPKSTRLTDKKAYLDCFKKASRLKNKFCTILVKENDLPDLRFGFVVKKGIVRKAVDRNKFKRACRESLRLNKNKLKALDIVFIAKRDVANHKPKELLDCLEKTWSQFEKSQQNLANS